MYLDFPEEALGALVASKFALELVYGEHCVNVMLCVSLLLQVRRLADLQRFACLRMVSAPASNGDQVIEVLHKGVGLRLHPVDNQGQFVSQWTRLEELDVERVAVTAVIGAPVVAARVGTR